jgi:YVTN family beta-propeller protein
MGRILSKTAKHLLALSTAVLVGFLPASLMAATKVYIPLGSGNTVIEVNGDTDKVVVDYGFVSNPHGSVATSDGEYVFASNLLQNESYTVGGESFNSSTALVHPAHGHVMSKLPVQGWSHHLAITPDDKYVVATHPMENILSVRDVMTLKIVAKIKTDAGPYYALVSSDGKFAYVSNSTAGTVQIIDTKTWSVVGSIDAGTTPEHMALSKDDKVLYVVSPNLGMLSEIVLAAPTQRKEYFIGTKLHGLDISDNGQKLFISSNGDEKLVSFDVATKALKSLSLSPKPYHLNTITGTGKVYVSSRSDPIIWVVDQDSLELITTIDLPSGKGHQMSVVIEK